MNDSEPTASDQPAIPDEIWGLNCDGKLGRHYGLIIDETKQAIAAKWSRSGTPILIGVSPARLAAAEARAERAEAERDKLIAAWPEWSPGWIYQMDKIRQITMAPFRGNKPAAVRAAAGLTTEGGDV